MSDHQITEEQVRAKAAEIQEHIDRWNRTEGLQAPEKPDVEAMARRLLERQGRPALSGPALLDAVRPQWERKAQAEGLTGEAAEAFVQEHLSEDYPQVYCETETVLLVVTYYFIHLNKAAAEMVVSDTETVLQALEVAAVALPEIDELLSPISAFFRAEATTIQAVAYSNDNGQVQLVGIYPSPFFIAESDDMDWDLGDKIDDIIHHIGEGR
ncbi:hypothetical protein ACIRBX_33965 [Kitasatospora sp. NPDC096147]|uniref:hypothetical protein n=1 Tax=Kitasatospora sp. NPDC096147 TaxID=3364093 RepID=UPI0038084F43